MAGRKQITGIYRWLFKRFGPQHWWPGHTRLEVIVGAILTQNTNWGNVEKAIARLRAAKCLTLPALHKLTHQRLATLIKPAGYFNVKARRLKNFIDFVYTQYNGKLKLMEKETTAVLREKLLTVNGVGPETADSIVLYAFDKPSFVIDAYTKRILTRHGMAAPEATYDQMKELFESALKRDVTLFNEYHALIVRTAKDFCKTKPQCDTCPLNETKLFLNKKLSPVSVDA